MRRFVVGLACVLSLAGGCASHAARVGADEALPPGAEARSLQGEPLYPAAIVGADAAEKEARLAEARAAHEREPRDADALVEYGRRLAAVGRYRDSIEVFTRGIELAPSDARMWRHRGHRSITLRRFDLALRDLERAAELVAGRADEPEPPMTPNARGVVIDTLQQNVFYHLALAHYLRGDFERALPAWRECAKRSNNDDARCSVTHWEYTTLRRLGRGDEARKVLERVADVREVIEYHGYLALCRTYRGELDADALWRETLAKGGATADAATVGYGVARLQFAEGRRERAREILAEVARAPLWAAFGRIAAEVDLAAGR